ncbi:MAG: hypothetical protein C0603_06705 [Denitrovibrio sp.]|nr:MAG: hypothetical protein C0603_06705 [Denitrovibrio sp.]
MLYKQEKLYVFCDESCTNETYMLYGGFACSFETQCKIQSELYRYKEDNGIRHEVKWNNCKKGTLIRDKGFVDIIFDYIDAGLLSFKFLTVNTRLIDYKKYYQSNKEKGFYAFYQHQLFNQFGRLHYNAELDTKFYIRLDDRTSKYPLSAVQNNLNDKMFFSLGVKGKPFKSIEVRDSKKCIHIQLNDVILGAACFCKNDKFNDPSVGDAKKEMASYIREKAGINFVYNTSLKNKKFNFWNFKLCEK